MQINLSGIPILPAEPPPLTSDIIAKDLMNTKVIAFPLIVSVDYIVDTLAKVSHQGFPVVKEMTTLVSEEKVPIHQKIIRYDINGTFFPPEKLQCRIENLRRVTRIHFKITADYFINYEILFCSHYC